MNADNMKKNLISLLFSLVYFSGSAQSDNQLFDMINLSFEEFIKLQTECGNDTLFKGAKSASCKFDDIYVAMENYPLGFKFSSQIDTLGFKYLYLQSNASRKILKSPRTVVFMSGPHIEGDILTIIFSTRTVVRKGNNINITTSGWVKCIWWYSCVSRKWSMKNIESGGI